MNTTMKWLAVPMLAGLVATGCGGTMDDGTTDNGNKSGIDASAFGGGKADFGKRAKLVDGIGLDSTVEGTFDPRVRAYGYTFDVKRGAKLTIDLTATAGDDARGLEEGETLDTVMAVYKNYEGPEQVGEKIKEVDDGEESLAAPTIELEVEETGTYFLAFTSYDDTGTGDYSLSLECDGTDLQCQRPDYDKPCEEGEKYVQGGQINEDTTWNTCEVVLMEPTTVAEETILTVKPGVTVKGNYLEHQNRNQFGTVELDVQGTLQAVGTEEHPIAFTALKENGWEGLKLSGTSNSLEHVFVEKAHIAIDLVGEATGTVRHAVLEGGVEVDEAIRRSEAGIRSGPTASVEFSHALVKGFDFGVQSQDTEKLVVTDSVIRENDIGVFIEGEDETTSCRRGRTNFDTYYDPIFKHVDIVENHGDGIRIDGSNVFVQVTKSNVVDNDGFGLRLRGTNLAPDSHLTQNNIYDNNVDGDQDASTTQVRTSHRNNAIVLEDNYWEYISDPQLSNSWNARCDGEISFSGFSPEPIADAGPHPDEIRKEVKQQSWQQQQSDDG